MVGVPRSAGCHLCVKRRVKCDQQKPDCGNCVKYGAECPGYERGFKFVAGKHVVRSRRKDPSLDTTSSASPSSLTRTAKNGMPFTEDLVPWGARSPYRSPASDVSSTDSAYPGTHSLTLITPRESPALFVGCIMQSLRNLPQSSDVGILNTWFANKFPPYMGVRTTLDSALITFALHILGKANNDQRILAESRQVYGRSLAVLQLALNHPVEWRTTETLAAAMVLCMFEVCLSSPLSHVPPLPPPLKFLSNSQGPVTPTAG